MDDNFTSSIIITKDSYPKFEEKNADSILDIKDLGDSYLIELAMDEKQTIKTSLDNGTEKYNVNVSIASAITALPE